MRTLISTLAVLASAVLATAAPAFAQYDRDGRYVPSPNGVPLDPNARTIPMYSGTPGGANGTPSLPRSATPPPPVIERLPTRSTSPSIDTRLPRYVAPKAKKRTQPKRPPD